jgi:hypothetical protein
MNLGLRRFEIVLVFIVAAACAYAASSVYFGRLPDVGSLFLIPHPKVLNEREAVLEALAKSSSTTAESEAARLIQLNALASSSKAVLPSTEDRLKVLQQLSESR